MDKYAHLDPEQQFAAVLRDEAAERRAKQAQIDYDNMLYWERYWREIAWLEFMAAG